MIHVDPRTGRCQATHSEAGHFYRARGTFQARDVYRALANVTAALLRKIQTVRESDASPR